MQGPFGAFFCEIWKFSEKNAGFMLPSVHLQGKRARLSVKHEKASFDAPTVHNWPGIVENQNVLCYNGSA